MFGTALNDCNVTFIMHRIIEIFNFWRLDLSELLI